MTYPISPPPEAKVRPAEPAAPFDPGADDGRCHASTWGPARRSVPRKPNYENLYGPGGYNRCVYTTEDHVQHLDEWGHVFLTEPRFKILRHATLGREVEVG